MIEAFSPIAPEWAQNAVHSLNFCCPRCNAPPIKAQKAWLNRYAPVFNEYNQKKWQEFYQCECEQVWWGWSSDRPPSDFLEREKDM